MTDLLIVVGGTLLAMLVASLLIRSWGSDKSMLNEWKDNNEKESR